jgi:hypothetical protein
VVGFDNSGRIARYQCLLGIAPNVVYIHKDDIFGPDAEHGRRAVYGCRFMNTGRRLIRVGNSGVESV